MADQDDRPAHGVDGGLRVLLVVGVRGLGGLRDRHRVAILLEDLRDGFPAGAIGECAMHEDHVLDATRGGTRRASVQSRTHQQKSKCSNGIELRHDVSPVRFHFVLLFSFHFFSRASAFVSRRRSSDVRPVTTVLDVLSADLAPAASIP